MAAPPGWIVCGCYYLLPPVSKWSTPSKKYLAQVSTKAHTTILATTSRTTLTQTFVNPSSTKAISELSYSFPLYDGVSVVAFTCRIGDRVITGEVKEKEKARAVYTEAKERGEVVGLLEQAPEASDVFLTKLGNVPPGASIIVDITYLGELKHDAEVDGVRFTIPSTIAPRYGDYPPFVDDTWSKAAVSKGFEVTIDAELSEGAYIREMRSPSHPIAVSLGTTSKEKNADPTPNKASATFSLGTAELDKDFVLQVVAKETSIPKAMLETHPTIPGQRALMATLVPKFALPAERPEIIFVCDRSGSMMGNKITALRNALKVFLKSLPLGVKFNICSFGSSFSFLWSKSKSYSQESLNEAMKHIETFDANFGGTEMYRPLEESIKRRYQDMNLEIFLVTDGEIWDQQRLFDLLNEEIGKKKNPIRVFTLGVGDAFSSSLIEGVARAGNGFSQAVGENEKLDGKVVRMLKAALSPHISDYNLEVKYTDGKVDKAIESLQVTVDESNVKKTPSKGAKIVQKAISLFDISADPDTTDPATKDDLDGQNKFAHLPTIEPPILLQAPHSIPPLFPFSRTTVYLLVSPLADQSQPVSVVLRATSKHGPLELEIPVQILAQPGETIHQLAAKKAVHELEEGRGWLASAKDASSGKLLKDKYEGRFSDFMEREAVRLGVQFQVGGKFCSFVAVEKKNESGDQQMNEEWEFLDGEVEKLNLAEGGQQGDYGAAEMAFGATKSLDGAFSARSSRGGALPAMRARKMAAPPGGPSTAAAAYTPAAYASRSGAGAFGVATNSSSLGGAPPSASLFGAPPPPPAPAGAPKGGAFFGSMFSSTSRARNAPSQAAPRMQLASKAARKSEPLSSEESYMQELDKSVAMALPDESSEEDCDEDESPAERINAAVVRGENLAGYKEKKKDTRYLPPKPKGAPPVDVLQALIELQTFEGYWALTQKLGVAIGVESREIENAAKAKGVDVKVLATALAVRYLTVKLADQEESWELVVEKAKGWLEDQGHGEESDVWKAAEGLVA